MKEIKSTTTKTFSTNLNHNIW